MEYLEKSDTDIFEIANPLWLDLVKASNKNDYGGFTKNFSETFITFKRLSCCFIISWIMVTKMNSI